MAGLINGDAWDAMGLLGIGMMQGKGGYQNGAAMAMQHLMGADQRALEKQKTQAQLGLIGAQTTEAQAQAEERRQKLLLATQAAERQNRLLFGGGEAPAVPGAAPVAGAGSAPTQAGGLIGFARSLGIPEQAIQADIAFNGGKKIAELLAERSKPNWQNVNGNLVNTNEQGFKGGLQPGMSASSDGRVTAWQPDGQGGLVVGAPRGALETYGAYQNVGERSKAAYDPLPITPPGVGSNPVMRSRLNVMQDANLPAPQPGMRGSFVGDPATVAASIAAIKDPQERANAQAAFEAQMRANGGGIPMQSPAEAGRAAAEAKLPPQAGGEINTAWLKNSYEPIVAKGEGARDLLDTVQVTRQAMTNMGSTGWGTKTAAAGAAILTGLGIAPANAKMFAANAEVFQTKVMEKVNQELNLAKGPQTDQDAIRAQQTWASLKNTTKANEFILDYAQAKAEVDRVRAQFYQQALPLARQRGDLSEVDREWAKLAPSIFTMPSLKRWSGGIK